MKTKIVRESVLLEPSYRNRIGKVTFVVSAYGNSQAKETAEDMLFRLMEEKVKEEFRRESELKEDAS